MPFEEIEGLRNREFPSEDHCNLVLAIKDNTDDSLYERFQKYWMRRCDNPKYLSDYDAWRVLSGYAREMFGRAEWYSVDECLNGAFWNRQSLSAKELSEAYLVAIRLMTMRYEIKTA